MKICHILWGLKTGGIETMLVNIINEQVRTENVMLVIINEDMDEHLLKQISPNCTIYLLHRHKGSKNPFSFIKMNLRIWLYNPDIIHVHTVRISKVIFSKAPMVRTIHNTHNVADEYPKMRALFSISNSVYDYTIKQGFSSKVIMNGIPMKDIDAKTSYSLIAGKYHIVQVSRLDMEQKGQDIAIEAVDILVNIRNIKNLKLHFIGEGTDRAMLERMVRDKNLSDYVVFEGLKERDYIFLHLKDYDLYLQPSRYEGFGLTVAEACAAKLPVLVSDIEGPLEIIDSGRLGMTFKNTDAVDLADKIEIVCHGNYDYNLIESAYQRCLDKYEVGVTAKEYIKEYRKIIEK